MERRRVLAIGLLAIAVILFAGVMSTTADGSGEFDPGEYKNETLENQSYYWKGVTLVNSTYAAPNESIDMVRTEDNETVLTVDADSEGRFAINTSVLEDEAAEYRVENSTHSFATITIYPHEFNATSVGHHFSSGGDVVHAGVSFDSSRPGGYPALISFDPDKASQFDLDQWEQVGEGEYFAEQFSEEFYFNITELDENVSVSVDALDTGVQTEFVVDPEQQGDVSYPVDSSSVVIQNGGSFWHGQEATLELDNVSSDAEEATIFNSDGALVFEVLIENETVQIPYRLEAGNYTVTYPEDEEASFTIKPQQLSIKSEDGVKAGEELNLTIGSNRSGYDLYLWTADLGSDALLDAIPAADRTERGDILVENVTDGETITLQFDEALEDDLYATATDAVYVGHTAISVEEDDGGGGGLPAPPPDDEDDEEDTKNESTTEDDPTDEDETSDSDGESTNNDSETTGPDDPATDDDDRSSSTADGAPGFGPIGALVAVVTGVLYTLRDSSR